jgi:YfiH family protein
MQIKQIKIFSDERLIKLGVISGTASRHTGSGREPQNVKKFFEKLTINPKDILSFEQVHGDTIISILSDADLAAYRSKPEPQADGWLIGKKGIGAMLRTCDCVPLFVWDEKGDLVALSHCGWKGVAIGLPLKTAIAVKEKTGKNSKLRAYIGPHINSCCFEVKEDVYSQFSKSSIIERNGKVYVDLNNEVILQLAKAGVAKEDIKTECQCACTCCNSEDFFSLRRDKEKNALISFVYKV